MKNFKFGNPPVFVNRTPIRKSPKSQNPAEKSAPTSKNQIQARPVVKTPKPQLPVVADQNRKVLQRQQKASNPKFSPQQKILSKNTNTINPASPIVVQEKPQIFKTPSESTRINLGVIDPPVPPISAKIIKSNVSQYAVLKNRTNEPQGFKKKMQQEVNKLIEDENKNNKTLSAQRSIQNKESFDAVVEERSRRVTTQVNDSLSSVNGLGGWRL